MAKEKITYSNLSVEELKENITSESSKLHQLKFGHATNPLENPMEIRTTRRNVARLKTELQKRLK